MIKVTVIALGRLKEKYLQSASEEYIKRLSRFCDLKIVELSPVKLSDNPTQAQIESALEAESTAIKKHIPKDSYVFSLCVEGKQLSSTLFSDRIKALSDSGKSICFIIGSSYGLSEEIKSISKQKLSFSEMTFPHQLFRILLLEQIYRSFMIIDGSKYHK